MCTSTGRYCVERYILDRVDFYQWVCCLCVVCVFVSIGSIGSFYFSIYGYIQENYDWTRQLYNYSVLVPTCPLNMSHHPSHY